MGQQGANAGTATGNEMLDSLRPYVDAGDYVGFWEEARNFDDPLAELALGFHSSLYGATFGNRVAISKLELAFNGGNRMSPVDLAELKSRVGQGVMEAHFDALRADFAGPIGTPGLLSVEQIDEYHYEYFESIGLRRSAYGGHLLSAFPPAVRRFSYCKACDRVGP